MGEARLVWQGTRNYGDLGMEGIEKREFILDGAEVIPGLPERRISRRRYTCGLDWHQSSGAEVRDLCQNPLVWSTKERVLWREIPGIQKGKPWILKFLMELEIQTSRWVGVGMG